MTSAEDVMEAAWKNLVKVNGSFYCNLSLGQTGDAANADKWPGASAVEMDKPIYVNHFNGAIQSPTPANRTILRIGDVYESANESAESTDHTLKLVIGEPLSLDTSEYVSWDGSQAQSGASTDDNAPDDGHGEQEDEDDDDDDEEILLRSPPRYAPPPPPPPVIDELTDSCCQFFNERQQRLFKSCEPAMPKRAAPMNGLEDKMEHLRREIVSLVNQDDALFRQLLALNTTIHQLRSQSMQSGGNFTGDRLRGHLSPAPSTNSLTSLTSMSDGEDDGSNDANETGIYAAGAGLNQEAPTGLTAAVSQALTRKRVSYPPRSRNRSGSQLSRYSFNSSSSTSSAASSASSSAVGSPTWSSGDKSGAKPARTPRSPHSSFYSRATSSKQHHSRLAITQKLQQRAPSSASAGASDLLMVLHKRQGSYDSGCQVSEPSDAEVFV